MQAVPLRSAEEATAYCTFACRNVQWCKSWSATTKTTTNVTWGLSACLNLISLFCIGLALYWASHEECCTRLANIVHDFLLSIQAIPLGYLYYVWAYALTSTEKVVHFRFILWYPIILFILVHYRFCLAFYGKPVQLTFIALPDLVILMHWSSSSGLCWMPQLVVFPLESPHTVFQ